MRELRNTGILITGASSGIGKAVANLLAEEGAHLILVARNLEKLERLRASLNSRNIEIFSADISNATDVESLFSFIDSKNLSIDIVINNAGSGLQEPFCTTSYDEWQRLINVNLNGAFLISKAAVTRFLSKASVAQLRHKTRGHIITVSSVAGLYSAPNYSAYCASKHGVTGLMRALKWELRQSRVKVSTIYPARVNTEFFEHYENKPRAFEMLQADDIAEHIVAIASESRFARARCFTRNILKRVFVTTLGFLKRAEVVPG